MSRSAFVALVLLTGIVSAFAPPYSIDWYTVDGGAAMNISGGTYSLSGTVGQPDAGLTMSGGPYSLDNGLWSLIAALQTAGPPRLTITRSGTNVVVCWPSPSTGFKLQQSTSLSPASWSDVSQSPTDNGLTKCVTLSMTSAMTFYRLSD